MAEVLIKQGAEGRIYVGEYNGTKCIIKERFIKKYRHPDLDKQITKERIRAESKTVKRCLAAGVEAPAILFVDMECQKIYMKYYENGVTVKDFIINTVEKYDDENEKTKMLNELCLIIGKTIGKLHANSIIHGDLTTSNILLDPTSPNDFKTYNIVMIDFGLSYYTHSVEDKGVDLYVLERALLSTHSELPNLFTSILDAYKVQLGEDASAEVIAKFEEVRARGRKRTMIG